LSSRIEQIIDEIEEYIEDCKPAPLSSGARIIVNKDEILELITELRQKTPEEIKRFQKIISNKDAIEADARRKAEEIIAQAEIHTNELISEHEIMVQAYAQANEVIMASTQQAQQIIDQATNDANAIRESAIAYTDDMLKNMENIVTGALEANRIKSESLNNSLQGYLDVIIANRIEISPKVEEAIPDIMDISSSDTEDETESE